jgi:hypothetical protein
LSYTRGSWTNKFVFVQLKSVRKEKGKRVREGITIQTMTINHHVKSHIPYQVKDKKDCHFRR